MRRLLSSVCWLAFVALTLGEPPAFTSALARDYDTGVYGSNPVNILQSVDFTTSQLLRRTWTEGCNKPGQHFFFTPHGFNISHNGPQIVDQDGTTLWFGHEFNNSYGLRPQLYRGQHYLTWWSGVEEHGHGRGHFYLMDQYYRLVRNISANFDGLGGDQHEFEITPDDTALVTLYVKKSADLTEFGHLGDGYIFDCYVQELDVETGELLFEWRLSDHIPFEENDHGRGLSGTVDSPWDVYHLNSVQKDHMGNYLISVRHTSTIYYISGSTGEILWRLGGKHNNFKTSFGNKIASFFGQHHARFDNDGSLLTIFDNGRPFWNNPARGLVMKVNTTELTANLVIEVNNPNKYVSETRGSMQLEPDGTILMGYGSAPAFTEFSSDGKTVLCDYQFGSLHAGPNGAWSDHGVASYRVYRDLWKGFPLTHPNILIDTDQEQFYVSWNGATEVRYWLLEGASNGRSSWAPHWREIASFEKTGFETNIFAVLDTYEKFRLSALMVDGNKLGEWTYAPNNTLIEQISLYGIPDIEPSTNLQLVSSRLFFIIGFVVAVVCTLTFHFRCCSLPYRRLFKISRPHFGKVHTQPSLHWTLFPPHHYGKIRSSYEADEHVQLTNEDMLECP